MDNDNTTLSSTHKILPLGFCLPDNSALQVIADIAMEKGSKEALAIFEKVLNEYLSGIPEESIIKAIVYFIKETFLHSKEAPKRKLDHITIPEQRPISCDLD